MFGCSNSLYFTCGLCLLSLFVNSQLLAHLRGQLVMPTTTENDEPLDASLHPQTLVKPLGGRFGQEPGDEVEVPSQSVVQSEQLDQHHHNSFQRHIFWLHIQKTGTSFFNTMYLNLCPKVLASFPNLTTTTEKLSDKILLQLAPAQEYCPNLIYPNFPGKHHPLRPYLHPKNMTVFTMLRDAKDRLLSAFFFDRHGSRNRNSTLAEFLAEPQIPNCQIKMILGFRCHQQVEESLLNVSKALQIFQSQHFFFGMTDRWDESICLFHAWYMGGRRQMYAFELQNNRPTRRHLMDTTILDQNYTDLDVQFLIPKAKEIFEDRLKEANCLGFQASV